MENKLQFIVQYSLLPNKVEIKVVHSNKYVCD